MSAEVFASAHGSGQKYSFIPPAGMFDSPTLKAHGKKVMETIGLVVNDIDDIGKLIPVRAQHMSPP